MTVRRTSLAKNGIPGAEPLQPRMHRRHNRQSICSSVTKILKSQIDVAIPSFAIARRWGASIDQISDGAMLKYIPNYACRQTSDICTGNVQARIHVADQSLPDTAAFAQPLPHPEDHREAVARPLRLAHCANCRST